MAHPIPKDRFGRHAGKWYKQARKMWQTSASGGYKDLGVLLTDLSQLTVRGMLATRSLFADDASGLPLGYKEIAQSDLSGPVSITVGLEDELAEGKILLPNDELRLVSEIPGGGATTVKSLPFDVALVDDEDIKITIRAVAKPGDVVPGIYEGFIRDATPKGGGGAPKSAGNVYALLKLRIDP